MTDKMTKNDAKGFLKNITITIPERKVRLTKAALGEYVTADLIPLLLCIDDTPRTTREIRKMIVSLEMTNSVIGSCEEAVLMQFILLLVDMGIVVKEKEEGRQHTYRRKSYSDVAKERVKDGRV